MLNKLKDFLSLNKNRLIMFLIFAIVVSLNIALFSGGIADFTKPTDLDPYLFFKLSLITLVIDVAYIYFARKYYSVDINRYLLIAIVVALICGVVSLSLVPLSDVVFFTSMSGYPMELEVIINSVDRLIFIVRVVLLLLTVLLVFMFVFSFRLKLEIKVVCVVVIVFAIVAIVYSLITQYKDYINVLTKRDDIYGIGVTSFFPHHNVYGTFLLISIFATIFLHSIAKNHYLYILVVLLFVSLCFTLSKLSIVLALGTIFVYLIYRIIVTFKDHKKRNIIFISAFSVVIIALVLVAIFVPAVNSFIRSVFVEKGVNTFNTRITLWKKTFEIIEGPKDIIIGKGFGYYAYTLVRMNNLDSSCPGNYNIKSPHNSYIQWFANGGVIGIALIAGLLIYVVYKLIKEYKINKDLSFVLTLLMVVVLVRAVFE